MDVVTGATGLVGSAVVRCLTASGQAVRVLVRPGSDRRLLRDLPVEIAEGDLEDSPSLRKALRGCQRLFHVAALYRLWAPDPRLFYTVNVEGTRRVLEAAAEAGAARVVYTSTVGTLGIPEDGKPGTEETPVRLPDMVGNYKRSKFLGEEVARDFARRGLPLVIVNPSTPVGPGDLKPTPTGQMIVDFLRGRMWAYLDTGLNLVDVDDVAAGHLLAAERGRAGERYILGGENLTLKQILDKLASITGLPSPRVRVPYAMALATGVVDELITGRMLGREPRATIDAVRMGRKKMFVSSAKAVQELGWTSGSVDGALRRAVDWFRTYGYA